MLNTKDFNRYSYAEFRARVEQPDAEQIDIDTLGAWFDEFGTEYWNGEYFDADGLRVFPVVEWDEENDIGNIVQYEIR